MKRIFRISLCAFLLLAGAACTRHKIIPDEKLAQIFHDAFLTNAYIGDVRVNIDSLNIYEPIFARYGYTTRDVYYTIGNFSKRKSARLGDVVEMAIDKLEAEGKFYDREVAVLDTIDNVARRTFTRTVYADSLIRVGVAARYGAPADRRRCAPGEYDCGSNTSSTRSTGTRKGLRGVVWLENRDGGRSSVYSTTLRRNRTENFTRPFHGRYYPPAPAPGFPGFPREAPASLGDGDRPRNRLHSHDVRCRRQPLPATT